MYNMSVEELLTVIKKYMRVGLTVDDITEIMKVVYGLSIERAASLYAMAK